MAKELGYRLGEDSLEQERKGAWQKCLLAALVKKHSQVSNPWLAKRRAMGHTAGMSKATSWHQDSEEGRKSIKHYEKIQNSRTDPIYDYLIHSHKANETGDSVMSLFGTGEYSGSFRYNYDENGGLIE